MSNLTDQSDSVIGRTKEEKPTTIVKCSSRTITTNPITFTTNVIYNDGIPTTRTGSEFINRSLIRRASEQDSNCLICLDELIRNQIKPQLNRDVNVANRVDRIDLRHGRCRAGNSKGNREEECVCSHVYFVCCVLCVALLSQIKWRESIIF